MLFYLQLVNVCMSVCVCVCENKSQMPNKFALACWKKSVFVVVIGAVVVVGNTGKNENKQQYTGNSDHTSLNRMNGILCVVTVDADCIPFHYHCQFSWEMNSMNDAKTTRKMWPLLQYSIIRKTWRKWCDWAKEKQSKREIDTADDEWTMCFLMRDCLMDEHITHTRSYICLC